jgi:hypothetical protein
MYDGLKMHGMKNLESIDPRVQTIAHAGARAKSGAHLVIAGSLLIDNETIEH